MERSLVTIDKIVSGIKLAPYSRYIYLSAISFYLVKRIQSNDVYNAIH